jgi:hypothetical protein
MLSLTYKENKMQRNKLCFFHHFLKVLLIIFLLALSWPALAYQVGNVEINPSAAVRETFDDNITYLNTDPKQDFITTATLGLSAKYEGKTQSLDFLGHINQEIFARNNDFNNTSEDFTLNFQKELSRYDRISLKNLFLHAQDPRSFEDAFGRTSGRYSYYKNRFSLGYSHDFSKQISLTGSYANEADLFSLSSQSDSYLNRIGLRLEDALSSSAILLFSYDLAYRTFDPGKNALTNTLAAGLRYYFTKQLYLEGNTGLDIIDSYDNRTYFKPLIKVSLIDDVDENTRTNITFSHKYSTNAYEQNIFNYTQIFCSVTRRLLERLAVSLNGFYGKGKYIGTDIKDKLTGAGIGFSYDIGHNIKGTLNYNYERAHSNVDSRGYAKNSITLGLEVDF